MTVSASTPVSDYVALAAQCRTQNQFNRLHIDLEGILAPAEMSYLGRLAKAGELPELSHPWLKRIGDFSSDLLDSPRSFQRTSLADTIMLYRDPGREPARKSLLVAFTGGTRRLMLPVSVFLQHLDSSAWDVVVLRRGPDRRPYARGLEGVARSFPAVMHFVEKAASANQHRRVVTLGTSAGGFAAIMGAILLHAARSISIGGGLPRSQLGLWLRLQLSGHTLLRGKPDIELVYGADFDRDRQRALALQSMFGGRLRPVPGVIDHNPFRALLARRELAAFLKKILG